MTKTEKKKRERKILLQDQNIQSYRNINRFTRVTQREGPWFIQVTTVYKLLSTAITLAICIVLAFLGRGGRLVSLEAGKGKTAQKLCVCLSICWFFFFW